MSNKERLLRLLKVLQEDTDEERALTLEEIKEKVENWGSYLPVGKKGLKEDLKTLAESDFFEVILNEGKPGLPHVYHYSKPLFDMYEIRLLVDAVSSARSISKKDTELFIEKLLQLISKGEAEKVTNTILVNDLIKSSSSETKYAVFNIHQAIAQQKMIKFQYGRYNVKKEFVFSNEKQFYEIEPYDLVWNSDNYYLIGCKAGTDDKRTYRLDRMRKVQITSVNFEKSPAYNSQKYMDQMFMMYSGEEEIIEVIFDNHLINVIIDRFGTEVLVKPYPEDPAYFILKKNIVISEGLVRWLLTWGSDAKVLKPLYLAERMAEEARKMLKHYEN